MIGGENLGMPSRYLDLQTSCVTYTAQVECGVGTVIERVDAENC